MYYPLQKIVGLL